MSSAPIPPAGQGKSWWSRSKSSKDSAGLKLHRSFSSLAEDDEKSPTSTHQGSSKPKDPTTSLRFNSLASAMGFKSRKLPALAIQDPPLPVRRPSAPSSGHNTREPTPTTPSAFYTNRPPATSISTVRSYEYDGDEMSDQPISEPRTPSDHPRDRMSYQNSVLTMSEMDPFAAGGVIIQQHDPNRLSVWSDSSVLDPQQKSDLVMNHRISFASSSSNSHGPSSEGHMTRAPSRLPQAARYIADANARGERRRHHSSYDRTPDVPPPVVDRQRAHARMKSPNSSNSSCSTVTPGDLRNRLSEPPGSVRLPHVRLPPSNMRARGMTMAGTGKDGRPHTANDSVGLPPPTSFPTVAPQLRRQASASSFGVSSPSSPNAPSPSPVTHSASSAASSESPVGQYPTRPLVLVRKASASMVHLPPPPSAPPAEDLPLPPLSPFLTSSFEDSVDSLAMAFPDPPSSSSSSMSFVSSFDLDRDDRAGNAIAQLMRSDFSSSENRSKGKGSHRHRHRREDSDLSPSTTVRDLDVERSAGSSRAVPPMPAVDLDSRESLRISSPRVLKKVASQSSLLGKRYSGASVASSIASVSLNEDSRGSSSSISGKSPRKQRSFHHSRLPPPLPTLRHANSYGSGNPLDVNQPSHPVPPLDPSRRVSVTSPNTPSSRKRLFSGSSIRRSTSSQAAPASSSASVEDDMRSIISLEEPRTLTRPTSSSGSQKVVMSFGSFGAPLSLMTNNACVAPSSYFSDVPPTPSGSSASHATSRLSQSEYTPQHIISPADMLKLEQQLADEAAEKDRTPKLELRPGDFGVNFIGRRKRSDSKGSRSRTDSVLSDVSAGTLAFGDSIDERGVFGEVTTSGLGSMSLSPQSPASTPRHSPSKSKASSPVEPSRLPLRSASMAAKSFAAPELSQRPSTGVAPSSSFIGLTRSPERPATGLPPPPRSRGSHEPQSSRPQTSHRRSSVVPLHALSPPPVRSKHRRPTTASSDGRDIHPSVVPPSAFDSKAKQRRSIMKKPSFLDIEDEADATAENLLDVEVDPPVSPVMDSSFLDMDRGKESFDTLRSSDSGYYM